jgi:cytochrome c peroxidase
MRARRVLRSYPPWAGAAIPTLAPPVAQAQQSLVERGRRLFFEGTFGGNGRTCGTCHPADNNYALDPAYVARLPARDPLFVAEFDPKLRDLERPLLLHKLALVAVHADGLDRPAVFRGVPHLLGIARSLRVEPGSLTPPGAARDLAAATGWSGDGAPGGGSLREFARAAVWDHLTRSLARVPGVDFRFPTAGELDALAAFMRSLGRPGELDVANGSGVTFRSALVERGRGLFNNEVSGPCAFCHRNATALNEGGFNGMFDTGTVRRLGTPARRLDPTLPGDGGFGASPAVTVGDRAGFGDGRMNTPSLIEAADTEPFFHDNSAPTVEAAVEFYTTGTFADSPEGQALPIIRLTGGDVVAIAAFLRALNAIENIRSSNAFLGQALGMPAAAARPLLRLASADTKDAATVLVGGPRRLYAESTALVGSALVLERLAARAAGARARDHLLRQAIELKEQARALILGP